MDTITPPHNRIDHQRERERGPSFQRASSSTPPRQRRHGYENIFKRASMDETPKQDDHGTKD